MSLIIITLALDIAGSHLLEPIIDGWIHTTVTNITEQEVRNLLQFLTDYSVGVEIKMSFFQQNIRLLEEGSQMAITYLDHSFNLAQSRAILEDMARCQQKIGIYFSRWMTVLGSFRDY